MVNLKKIQNVIMFISSTKYVDIHTIDEVKNIKQENWTYLDYMVSACDEYDYNLDIQAKMEDAALRKAVENAKTMLSDELPPEKVALYSGLPLEQVLELQKQDPHTVTDIYETIKPHMVTNMSNDIYLDLAGAKRVGEIRTIPGEGVTTDLFDEYHVDDKALYEMILDVFYIEES